MEHTGFKVYGYRWIVLAVFMLVVAINQLAWITFASITSEAAKYYQVTDLSIGLLSMSFMVVFIFLSIPASWAIDTYGFRIAVSIGAALTALFGLTRGLFGPSYTLVLISQIGIAIGQPFILNAVTKVAARWFPIDERATASGFGTLAMFLGILLGLILTPYLTIHFSIPTMLLIYGIVAIIAAIVFIIVARERPVTPPCPPGGDERTLVFEGLKQALRKREFILMLVVFFVGLGVFNGVTTWIEDILRPRGFGITQAGITGGLMVGAGILGALILPTLSDRYRRRVPFILIGLAGATVGLVGVTFSGSYGLLLVSSFVMGFFLLSAAPIGFQYGAEVTYPTPEATSNGMLLLMGQISGILFILGMDQFKTMGTGSMTPSLLALIFLMVIAFLLCIRLKESAVISKPPP
jgi:MFS family permease